MPPAPKSNSYKDRFVGHVKRHKVAYSVGAGIGIGITISLLVRRTVIVNTNTVSPVFNTDISPMINLGGHTTKMVKRLSDGKIWEKVTEAAAEEGYTVSLMSRHLNGHKPDIYGETYKIIGVGTTG